MANRIRPLVMACDEAYATQLATTLRSVVDSHQAGWPLECHVLCEGFSEAARKKVLDSLPAGSASVRWIPVELKQFRGLSTEDHISTMTFARFLIPDVFPATVSRVLYLDVDVLVLDDLDALWTTDLDGAVLGAVVDGLDWQIKANKPGVEEVPRVREYFNAGVLLIDLDRWRAERISEKAVEYLVHNPTTPFADQDALNVVCDGRWKPLDSRWNFQGHLKQKIADIAPEQRPGIVHFVTYLKPWNSSSLSVNASFYDAVRSRTCFARTRVEEQWDLLNEMWYRSKRALKRTALWRTVIRSELRAR